MIPGLGRYSGKGNSKLHQYACLENPMDRGAWHVTVHGVSRVGHDLATKPPPLNIKKIRYSIFSCKPLVIFQENFKLK